jgi:hypothetical protein
VQGRQVPHIQRVHPRSALSWNSSSKDSPAALLLPLLAMIILWRCLTKELLNMRVEVVPSFFLSSKEDPVRHRIGPVTDRVGQDMVQDLLAIGVGMTG